VRLLLDTHAFLWWVTDNRSLSRKAYAAIEDRDSEVFVSAASAWEIATKFRLGRLDEAGVLAGNVAGEIASEGFQPLPISVAHAQMAGSLPGKLQDPFDRMLIAQAMLENLTLVTIEGEAIFGAYAVKRLW
jgi:PIN domain nuclease of toxin-antitoxin system